MAQEIHPSQADLLGFFAYEHLSESLQAISRPFAELADNLVREMGSQTHHPAQLTTSLRKLLEAKDCAVRAALPPHRPPDG